MKKIFTLIVAALMVVGANAQKTIDDICGPYESALIGGYSYASDGAYCLKTTTPLIQIQKVDADYVMITGLGYALKIDNIMRNVQLKCKFDAAAQTLTVDTTYTVTSSYITKAYQYDAETVVAPLKDRKPAVATINTDGTIQINYAVEGDEGAVIAYKETLTPIGSVVWRVVGNLNYLDKDGNVWDNHSYKGTLVKYEGIKQYEYELTFGDPDFGYTSPKTMQFNIWTDGTFNFTNSKGNSTEYYWNPFSGCSSLYIDRDDSGFDGTPSETSGKLHIAYQAKENYTTLGEGELVFTWPYVDPTGITSVTLEKTNAPAVIKTPKYIIKDGKKFNYAGQRIQ